MTYSAARSALHDMVLLTVYTYFARDGEWPRYRRLELELENEVSAAGGLYKLLREIGTEYVSCDSPELEDTKIILSVRGVARCRSAAHDDLGRLLRVARFAADVYRRNHGVTDAHFSLAHVFPGADSASIEMRRLVVLLRMCEWTGPLGGLEFQARRPAMVLDGVNSIDSYFERLSAHNAQRRMEMSLAGSPGPLRTPSRLFLSHSSRDEKLARFVGDSLQLALPSTGVFVASVPGHIPAGAEWLNVIFGQLREADTYLVVMTPQSVTRQWVWFESGAAWMSEKRLIVVTAGGLGKSEVPMPLAIYQALDLTNEADVEQLFSQLTAEPADAKAFCESIVRIAADNQSAQP